MKPYTYSFFLMLMVTLSMCKIPTLTESRRVAHVNKNSPIFFSQLEEDPDQNDNPDKELHQLASPDFFSNACNYTNDKDTCKQVLDSILSTKPKIEETDPDAVAYKTVRLAQRMYGDVAVAVKTQIKDEDGKKESMEVKKALSGCYKMYLDIVHEIRKSVLHLRKRRNVCPASEFTVIAIANPKDCENQLNRAGTSGQKLGLYKDYKELLGVAETCKSVIWYLAHSQGVEMGTGPGQECN